MTRFAAVGLLTACALGSLLLTLSASEWWWFAAAPLTAAALTGVYDLIQRRHSVLRNYPVLGHLRFFMETLRPELQQYFVERNYDGRPFDRDTRSIVYERAKGVDAEEPFGSERDMNERGYEFLVPSMVPVDVPDTPPRVRIGGADCTAPYDMALLNVSAMSFGSLSANAVVALNTGAARGGFAHDTGEGACPCTICAPVATSSGRSVRVTSAAAPVTGTSTRGSSPRRPPIRPCAVCRSSCRRGPSPGSEVSSRAAR